jgi:hypothetical protein
LKFPSSFLLAYVSNSSSSRKRNGAEVVTLKNVDLNGDGYGYPIGVLAIAAAVVSTSNTQLSDGFEPDRMGTRAS